jgi:hypothetical protein
MAHLVKEDRNQDKQEAKDGGQTVAQWSSSKILNRNNRVKHPEYNPIRTDNPCQPDFLDEFHGKPSEAVSKSG